MIKLMLIILTLATAAGAFSAEAAFYAAPEDTPVQTEENDNEEADDSDKGLVEDTPLEEFTPSGATWEAWIGPLLLGVFALFLWTSIRWYSLRSRRKIQEEIEEKRAREQHKPRK